LRIAILGGGHGCYAAAADLSEQGHEVRLWRRDAEALVPVIEAGIIRVKDGGGQRDVRIALATGDIGAALDGAELIVLPTPALAQQDIARRMAPHLVDGQVVFLAPGTFGSYLMARTVWNSGNHAAVSFAETGTLPYLARKHGPAEVAITIRATRLPTGVFPASRAAHALVVIARAYPAVEPCGDALSGALMNAGPVIHPPLIMMNAAPLQHFGQWDIHNEGTQPAVRSVTDRLDAERVAVREALGYGAPHFPLADHYNNDRWMYGDAHKKLVDSGDWREHIDLHTHRYMREDTAMGLAFLVSVAHWAGIDVPVASGLLAMAGAIVGEDLALGERTLGAMGLERLDARAMTELLQRGFA
jgi:opine dehydrogenase